MEKLYLAKELKDNKQYDDAATIYKEEWDMNKKKWDGWNYAHCLYLQSLLDEAYNVAMEVYKLYNEFEYNRNLFVRIINDKYFKLSKPSYTSEEIEKLYDLIDFTYELLPNQNKKQIEFCVFRTLKISKKNSKQMPFERVLKILSYLSVDDISDKPYEIEIWGKAKEIQSNKEAYYSYKTKALLSLKKYTDCIECCDEAAEKITKFHHDNDIWLSERKMQSIAELGDLNGAIKKSEHLVYIKDNWFLKYSLAQLYLKNGNFNMALLYMCRAAYSRDPLEMKVNMLVQLGDLIKNIDIKNKHYLLAEKIRVEKDWSIPYELERKLYGIQKQEVDILDLKKYWLSIIEKHYKTYTGKIKTILQNSKTGFIIAENCSYYFKVYNVINGRVKVGDCVKFVMVEAWDSKKNVQSTEANYILVL